MNLENIFILPNLIRSRCILWGIFYQNSHSNKISTVQFGIQLCQTDPRLSCSFSTLNPRAAIDRRDFQSVRWFTVEIWLE